MKTALLLLLAVLAMLLPAPALADETETGDVSISDGVQTWMKDVDWQAFDALLSDLSAETRALWDGITARQLTEDIALSGGSGASDAWSAGRFSETWKMALAETCGMLAGTVATLVGLSLLSALCAALTADGRDGVQQAASFVCRCFTLTVVLGVFASMAKLCADCTDALCRCMEIAAPVLMTLLTAVGGAASVGVLQPAMTLVSTSVAMSVKTVVIPLTLCAGVLTMFGQLSERIQLNEMGTLIKSVVKWSIGLVTTLYTAITTLRGMTAAAFDGVRVRTAKYAAGSMFPMVGGLIGGSFDTVLGCAGLVKNAAGLTTILLGVSVAAGPMLRIGITMLLFRLTAATLQPIAEKNQVAMCRAAADMMSGLLAALAAITSMCIVTVGIAVALGNAGMLG